MFSSKSYLEKKTGPYGIGRLSYLQSLVNEYQNTDDIEAKKQIMANLANFAYDPINYENFRTLNILDLFLDGLEESEEDLVEFAVGGICNACAERDNRKYVIDNGGVKLVIGCLSRYSEDTVLSAITTLMYLVTQETRAEITCLPVVECMLRLSQSKNVRLRNLATVFLEDYCNDTVIQEAKTMQKNNGYVPTT
ncbi:armadillo repeat-containing protein 7-like [Mercenaria mercenaria]|uniref:armadillo repeat-containing protein 7-like n=1 Tax=Mercenaria mercenaria TaxID=6596 RepID=UPI00234E51FF|nr:armadillo repeat-containing protein 7-like [Mercenaria mercenaria]XP_045203246.2 armadillo repeat-containing protein 7-like [Mercenaria mercenaria]